MLIVLDTDGIVNLYDSPEQAERHLEAIDIEGKEYEMCDERGQRYVGKILTPVTTWHAGAFRLEPEGWPSHSVLTAILGRAQILDHAFGRFQTLEDLKALSGGPGS